MQVSKAQFPHYNLVYTASRSSELRFQRLLNQYDLYAPSSAGGQAGEQVSRRHFIGLVHVFIPLYMYSVLRMWESTARTQTLIVTTKLFSVSSLVVNTSMGIYMHVHVHVILKINVLLR